MTNCGALPKLKHSRNYLLNEIKAIKDNISMRTKNEGAYQGPSN